MKLSISDLLPYLDCQYAGQQRLKANAWGAPGNAVKIGSAVHEYMAWILGDRKGDEPLIALSSVEDQRVYEHCISAVKDWIPPFEVKLIEHALEAELPRGGVSLQGLLDALVVDEDGFYWSLQWKTVGRGVNIGSTLEKVRMSPHEIAYHWLVKESLGIELAGTILGTFKKHLTKEEQKMGVPIFQLWHLNRTADEAAEAMQRDIAPVLISLAIDMSMPRLAPRNWTSCLGYYGNSPCPLFGHCHNGLPIMAMGLIPLEDRYAQEDPAS